jgi:hypothetical protein
MADEISYDARVYKTEVYKGSRVTTYKVWWKVGYRLWKEAFRTAAQADSFRSALFNRGPEGRGVQTGDRSADGVGANQGRDFVVRVRLPVCRHEVDAGLG